MNIYGDYAKLPACVSGCGPHGGMLRRHFDRFRAARRRATASGIPLQVAQTERSGMPRPNVSRMLQGECPSHTCIVARINCLTPEGLLGV